MQFIMNKSITASTFAWSRDANKLFFEFLNGALIGLLQPARGLCDVVFNNDEF